MGPDLGKARRLSRIMGGDGRSLIMAMDHGFEHGPGGFASSSIDPAPVFEKVLDSFDGFMVTPGVYRRAREILSRARQGLVIKISGKTEMRPEATRDLQSPIAEVEDAVGMGADGIAVTIYWGSRYEHEMMAMWSRIASEARRLGVPVLQLAYPRPLNRPKNDPEAVAYAVRAAAEVGADVIKTYYTGSRESFSKAVEASLGVPVLMSGGPERQRPLDFLKDLEDAMAAGARGAVVGRNVFNSRDPGAVAKAAAAVVHDSLSAEDAAKRFGLA